MRTLIVDGHNLVMRNVMASALDDFKANGVFTGGVYGSIRLLRSLVLSPDIDPHRVVVCFDNGVPARRRRLLPNYKSGRKARRDVLPEGVMEQAFAQVVTCYELFGLLGVVCLSYKDREADDCVAAVVRKVCSQGDSAFVASSDADLLQTVRMGAAVHDFARHRVVTHENFAAEVGVPTDLYLIYRALVGDPSDSIEGARGCGPKRAQELLVSLVESRPPVTTLKPLDQLHETESYLRGLGRPLRGWEESVLRSAPYLRDVLKAIDLGASFGSEQVLDARLLAIPEVREVAFLRACRSAGLRSILGDPRGYVEPFKKVQKLRAELAARS